MTKELIFKLPLDTIIGCLTEEEYGELCHRLIRDDQPMVSIRCDGGPLSLNISIGSMDKTGTPLIEEPLMKIVESSIEDLELNDIKDEMHKELKEIRAGLEECLSRVTLAINVYSLDD